MVLNTSELLPDPETPVNTVSRRFGIRTLMSRRLFSRAPWTRIQSWLSATSESYESVLCVVVMVDHIMGGAALSSGQPDSPHSMTTVDIYVAVRTTRGMSGQVGSAASQL